MREGGQARRVEPSPVNQSQRIVSIVALGVALLVVGWGVNLLMLDAPNDLSSYVPGTGASRQTDAYFVVTDDEAIVRHAGVWLLAVATWAAASLWLVRSREEAETT